MNIPISYQWLQAHFDKKLPKPEEISALFMKHLCEVEGMEKHGDDTIFDLKILPDRGHDLLAHDGIAREVSVLTEIPYKERMEKEIPIATGVARLRVDVRDTHRCFRYTGRVVEGVKVAPSPDWLRARLESVGQRSINNIVDITNFVMLELGQPMHAFDVEKLARARDGALELVVRGSKFGEHLTTLDGKDVTLPTETLVVADGVQPLAIAGIKGGKVAGVSESTTAIVFESANFESVNIRKTSQRVGIRTDSSRRFDNRIAPFLTEEAMHLATELLLEVCPEARVGEIFDTHEESPRCLHEINMATEDFNNILGAELTAEDIEQILKRLSFSYRRTRDLFTVIPPYVRLDLRIKEDIAEEVGRVYGYENIAPVPIPTLVFNPKPLKTYVYANMIRDALITLGFSEVYTYSFQNEGFFAVLNPIAEDKGFLRKNLSGGLTQALALNVHNAPLVGPDEIKIFEIGRVFPGVGEEILSCAFGVEILNAGKKKAARTKDMMEDACSRLSAVLKVPVIYSAQGNIFEFDLSALLEKLPEVSTETFSSLAPFKAVETRYQKISIYPYVLRDIALWVPEGVRSDAVHALIRKEAGELLVSSRLFDVFTKEFPTGKRTSYAFNLVFQSHEKTLSDDEVNEVMGRITSVLTSHSGWEVR